MQYQTEGVGARGSNLVSVRRKHCRKGWRVVCGDHRKSDKGRAGGEDPEYSYEGFISKYGNGERITEESVVLTVMYDNEIYKRGTGNKGQG